MAESVGAMVNYRYEADSFAENHEKFASHKEVVASKAVRALVKTSAAA